MQFLSRVNCHSPGISLLNVWSVEGPSGTGLIQALSVTCRSLSAADGLLSSRGLSVQVQLSESQRAGESSRPSWALCSDEIQHRFHCSLLSKASLQRSLIQEVEKQHSLLIRAAYEISSLRDQHTWKGENCVCIWNVREFIHRRVSFSPVTPAQYNVHSRVCTLREDWIICWGRGKLDRFVIWWLTTLMQEWHQSLLFTGECQD